jgi:DNA-binding protein HU-beta
MNKGEFVNAISKKTKFTKKDINEFLDMCLETIVGTVADGEKITFVGFGSFELRNRKARNGRNPQTGETMEIPSSTIPYFSAGKNFKDKCNR